MIIASFVKNALREIVKDYVTMAILAAKMHKENLMVVVLLMKRAAEASVALLVVGFVQMANVHLANRAILVWFVTQV